jgi:hypothetical protein
MDVIIETHEESQHRYLGQAVTTTKNTPTKERVILGYVFHLSSNHILNLIVKNTFSLGVKPYGLNIRQDMHLPSRPEGVYAGRNSISVISMENTLC